MIAERDICRRVEDLFYGAGLQTYCRFRRVDDEDVLEAVFPLHEERELFKIANELRPAIRNEFGVRQTFVSRTIIYHLAYERFGFVERPEDILISTTVTNAAQPTVYQSGAIQRLEYEVDIVAIGQNIPVDLLEPRLVKIALDFNSDARYLRINGLRFATALNRGLRLGETVNFRRLDLDVPQLAEQTDC
jgi:hypothetical protein